jgi:hypothetical protein
MKNAPLQPAEQSGKWGYTNPQGKFVISPQFDCAERFSDGLAVVEVKERFGYVDSDGQLVIPPKYFAAGIFKEGFAWVMTRKPWMPLGKGELWFCRPAWGRHLYRSPWTGADTSISRSAN